jgi:hypothetical protein
MFGRYIWVKRLRSVHSYSLSCELLLWYVCRLLSLCLAYIFFLQILNREPSQSEVSEIPMEQPPKPKPRRRLHRTGIEHSCSRSLSHAALLQESDSFINENKELSTNLQQLTHSSQDSGYQQSEHCMLYSEKQRDLMR